MDTVLKKCRKAIICKIDVEGMELNVIKGMSRLFERDLVEGIVFEFIPKHQINAGNNPIDLIKFLYDINFDIYFIDRKSGETSLADEEKILSRDNTEFTSRNLFAKK